MRPSQTQDKFIVRLPEGMREQISEAAATNGRSMTAEIVARLTASFQQANTAPSLQHLSEEIEILRGQIRGESALRHGLEQRLNAIENHLSESDQ